MAAPCRPRRASAALAAAWLLASLLAGAHGFLEAPFDSGLQLSALEAPHRAQLGEFLDKVVNQVLRATSSPDGMLGLLSEEEWDPLHEYDNNTTQCVTDLNRWKSAINSSETWALQMVDSASKFVTGILYGQSGDLGDFDECVESTPGTLGTGDDFTGLYALPKFTVYTAVKGSPNNTFTNKLVSLQFAMCAPSTCSPEYLQTVLKKLLDAINAHTEGRGLHLQGVLEKKHTSQYGGYRKPETKDWAIAGVCVFLASIVVIATTIDLLLGSDRVRPDQGWGSKLVIAFSARRNGKKLLAVAPSSGGDTMGCIHGIRVFSMLWIVQGHRWSWATGLVAYTNATYVFQLVFGNYAFIILVADALLSVDTYFVVGGIVNTYVFMKTIRKTNRFNILQYYIHRYVRLTPAFMFVIGISATWFSLLGNGPLWYWVNDTSVQCQKSWWTNLLYVANYVNVQNQCHVLWYPNTDMQLFWVSPLALIPLWKRPRMGVIWLLFLILVSCIVPLVVSLINDYRFIAPIFEDFGNKEAWRDEYWGAHMRATPYFVGLFVGYLLYLIKIEKRSFKLNAFQNLAAWVLVTVICMAVMVPTDPLFDTRHVSYNKLASGFYIAFARLGWSIVISWIVVACVTGHGGPINSFLSWPPFAVVGRLTYGIYLVHNLVQQVDFGLYRTAEFFSPFKMTHRMVADFTVATFLAAVLSLMLESPIMLIEKWLWETPKPKKVTEKERVGVA